MNDLVLNAEFDFSKYQPGYVLVFKMWTQREHSAARQMVEFAKSKGVSVTAEYDEFNMELRVKIQ